MGYSAKFGYVYILTNNQNGTLYTGVTSNLIQRVWQHKNHVTEGFTDKFNVNLLVWYEQHESIVSAITREKSIKKWQRQWKLRLIREFNPGWKDLYFDIGS